MSGRDVYRHEMPKRVLTGQEIELLLSGEIPQEEDLARFWLVLTSLHHPIPSPPTNERVLALAARAAEISLDARERQEGGEREEGPNRGRGFVLKRKLAGGLAAAVLLSGMTGVAVAADNAIPGDALYGLDRALEAVGIGDGGAEERLAEARSLLENGQTSTAIEHLADAVDVGAAQEDSFSPEAARASDALRGAAETVRNSQADAASENVREAVAAMLSEIAAMLETQQFDGAALGATISEMARALGAGGSDAAAPGKSEDAGQDAPGRSGNSGQENRGSGENRGGPPSETPGASQDNPGSPPNRP
jgi:hypothetical protein